jgi:ABC-type transport system involved in multi-copper enzyme maturation permease subunit
MNMSAVTIRSKRAWGLPLLMKELAEQSARKRTYVIRTLYATLLFAFATFIFWVSVYREINSPFEVLGRGREMFLSVVFLQLAGIYLFMPAITCGVITAEKERNTIGLLLLTKLGPWTILLEKLLGRLVPMGTFLLLSLPLLGFSYALGGVTQGELWTGVLTLFLTVIQVGALALACSAYFRTTVQAFIATYVIGFLMYFGPLITMEVLGLRQLFEAAAVIANAFGDVVGFATYEMWTLLTTGAFGDVSKVSRLELRGEEVAAMFFAPLQLMDRWNLSPWHVLPRSLPTLMSIVFFIVAARVCLIRRAFVPARNRLLNVFRKLDAVFHRINDNRVTKGIVIINESATLPDDEPVAWRETKKKSLGTVRYLIRIFVATEFPVLILCLLLAMTGHHRSSHYGGSEPITALIIITWIAVTLLISVKSATLISGERSHETLDVLLSTPIRSGDLVRQKFRGVRRLMLVLAMPLLTMIAFQTYWREATQPFWSDWNNPGSPVLYLVSATLAVVIYLPMVAWISFAVGLWVRSQARAIFGSLAVIVAWCVIPMVIGITIMEVFRMYGSREWNWLMLLGPASIIPFTEFSGLDEFNHAPWLAVLLNTLTYGSVLFVVRLLCLTNAPGLLGRAERPPVRPHYPEPAASGV